MLADGPGQGIDETGTPPLSSPLTWTLADCTDWIARDWREFESRSEQLASRHR